MKKTLRKLAGILTAAAVAFTAVTMPETNGLLTGLTSPALATDVVPYNYYTANGSTALLHTDGSCSGYTVVESSTDNLEFTNENWYVVKEDATVSAYIKVTGEANLILCNNATLTVNQGIRVSEGNTLNIYAQNGGTGALVTTGVRTFNGAGIGGHTNNINCGTVSIHGGNITAYGSVGAGIGGGANGNGGDITIYNGTVYAEGPDGSAGIGGGALQNHQGSGGNGGNVTIYGGSVVAIGDSGAGIGYGNYVFDVPNSGTLTLGEGMYLYGGNDKN